MATRNLVPRNSGEGSVGKLDQAWGSGVFDNLFVSGLDIFESLDNAIDQVNPFLFFPEVQNNTGPITKQYYNTPNSEIYLSGVTVSTAEDFRVTMRWDGPGDEYMGEAKINGQVIPFENIHELGEKTRRFEGYINNLNFEGQDNITGEANGRKTLLPLIEVGPGPDPVNISIDPIQNATPKAGEQLGQTHLKEGDSVNIYIDFDRNDIDRIKIFDYGLAKEIDYVNYSLQNINGLYRASVPIEVSNRQGDLSVAIQAVDHFGGTGELIESSSFNHSDSTRLTDQTYPIINVEEPTLYNGRTDGLRNGETVTFTNDIFNWVSGIDLISYQILSPKISMNNTTDYERIKTVSYVTGVFSDEDNIEIQVQRLSNGSTKKEGVNIKVANAPLILRAELEASASSATAPNIVGSSQVKSGDTVNATIVVDGKGSNINEISISVLNVGLSDGSQTSFSSNYNKTILQDGSFQFIVPIKVYGTFGESDRDGQQSASLIIQNSSGTLGESLTTSNTIEVHNGTVPIIDVTSINYPIGQQAIKQNDSVTISHTITQNDLVEYSSINSELSIIDPTVYNTSKTVSYSSGTYNIDIDGGQNNLKISATRLQNGAVVEKDLIVNIANQALSANINNLIQSLETLFGADNSDNFYLSTNQLMLEAPSLDVDPNQLNPSIVTNTASGTGKLSNAYTLTVKEEDSKGTFTFAFLAKNLAGVETTIISSSPNYSLEGFAERTVYALPTDLAAGLISVGTQISNPNNLLVENVSEGGDGANGGTYYTYKQLSTGTQLDNLINFNNQFTVCDENGVVNPAGSYLFNLDKNNRSANTSTDNPSPFIISE